MLAQTGLATMPTNTYIPHKSHTSIVKLNNWAIILTIISYSNYRHEALNQTYIKINLICYAFEHSA